MSSRIMFGSRNSMKGLFGLAAWLVCASAWSQANIEGVEFSSLPGDKTEIRLVFDGAPPEPTGYTIEEPARIVLDMPGVASTLEQKHHNLGIGNARRVSIITTKDRTRAIVNLTELVNYDTEIQGNTLFVVVGADTGGVPTSEQFAGVSSSSQSSARWSILVSPTWISVAVRRAMAESSSRCPTRRRLLTSLVKVAESRLKSVIPSCRLNCADAWT